MQRITLVCNSKAVDLRGGAQDAQSVYDLLVNSNLGQCNEVASQCLIDCPDKAAYQGALNTIVDEWSATDQLVLYYSGHGIMRNSHFCFVFGENKNDLLPFSNVIAELAIAGVTRALIIIDACHSGGARLKGNQVKFEVISEAEIPNGMALLASSNEDQWSAELDNGTGSVFTSLLCDAVNSGLNSTATMDNLIAVPDVMDYIGKRIRTEKSLERYLQTPNYHTHGVDRTIWLARNTTERAPDAVPIKNQEPHDIIRSIEELKFVYETTHHLQKPCPNARPNFVDWKLIDSYLQSISSSSDPDGNKIEILDSLGLLVPMGRDIESVLHYAAALCFCKNPERVIPNSYSVFIYGDTSDSTFERREITGPLVFQIEELTRLTLSSLNTTSDFTHGINRTESLEIPREVVREAISNAVVHRNYETNGTVQVSITRKEVTITNPGKFSEEATWLELMNGPRVSCPTNGAIALYVSRQMGMEGIGRGFEIFREYIREYGMTAISFSEIAGPTTQLRIKRDISTSTREELRRRPTNFNWNSISHKKLLDEIEFNLVEGRNTLLLGRRGSGKTSIMFHLTKAVEHSRDRRLLINASSCSNAAQFLGLLIEAAERSSMTFSSDRKKIAMLDEQYTSSILNKNTNQSDISYSIRKISYELLGLLQRSNSSLSILVDDFDVFCMNVNRHENANGDISIVLDLIRDLKSEFRGVAWLLCATQAEAILQLETRSSDSINELQILNIPNLSNADVERLVERYISMVDASVLTKSNHHEITRFVFGLSLSQLNVLFSNVETLPHDQQEAGNTNLKHIWSTLRSPKIRLQILDDLLRTINSRLPSKKNLVTQNQLALVLHHAEGVIHVLKIGAKNVTELSELIKIHSGIEENVDTIVNALEKEHVLIEMDGQLMISSHYMRWLARSFANSMQLGFYKP